MHRSSRISYQLLFWFLLLAIPAEVLLIWVSYHNAEKVIISEVTNGLQAVADRQSTAIERYLEGQEQTIQIYSILPNVIEATHELVNALETEGINSTSYQTLLNTYRKELHAYNSTFEYTKLFLVSNKATVFYTSEEAIELGVNFNTRGYEKGPLASLYNHTNLILQTEISDFMIDDAHPIPSAYIATPIKDEGKIIAILIAQINNQQIEKVVNDYVGLGETGESMLLSREAKNALFTTNTRHLKNAAFTKRLSLDDAQYSWAKAALSGKRGSGIITDYRDKETLAVWSYVPALRSGLVTKIDGSEAFQTIKELRLELIGILVATTLLLIVIAIFVARSISRPIQLLTAYTQLMAAGDLQQEVTVRSNNEIGELSKAFNQMAANLHESNNSLKMSAQELQLKHDELMTQNEELVQQREEIASQRDFIENQNKNLRQVNERMTDSIRYAQTIQNAILPTQQYLTKAMGDYFVIYRPKDIVSGDYYWAYEQGNVKYIAVVDCTGHGVPGAFMSILSHSMLNEAVTHQNQPAPSEILEIMDALVRYTLQLKKEGVQDGMDIALCKITKLNDQESKLEYTGAKRPLFYINYAEGNTLEELKGTRRSVGGYRGKMYKPFKTEELILPKNSPIYLSSDGFADQHDLANRKIGSLKLKELLFFMKDLPMKQQQERLEHCLHQHQQSQEQRDDITIMGFRV